MKDKVSFTIPATFGWPSDGIRRQGGEWHFAWSPEDEDLKSHPKINLLGSHPEFIEGAQTEEVEMATYYVIWISGPETPALTPTLGEFPSKRDAEEFVRLCEAEGELVRVSVTPEPAWSES